MHRKMIKQKTPKKGRYHVQVRTKINTPVVNYYKQPLKQYKDEYYQYRDRLHESEAKLLP
jgi:hypothetical protein